MILFNTFLHVPGIGKTIEEQIWKNNCLNWDEFLKDHNNLPISPSAKLKIYDHINKSKKMLKDNDLSFLKDLPKQYEWRVYRHCKCCFLDIETTGLDKRRDDVTIIGMYDGTDSKILVKGKDLDNFKEIIKDYDMIISFNGRCFDIPFLSYKFPDADLDKMHVDLRFLLRQLGYSGGLKRIEKELGISRDDEVSSVDGMEAVRLWYRYKRGDPDALKTLVKYNQADIENLKFLMDIAFKKLREKEFLCYI